jgi:hypothetical protein
VKLWRAIRKALTLRNVRRARERVSKYRAALQKAMEKLHEIERKYLGDGK